VTVYVGQGQTLGYEQESALGTNSSTFSDIRWNTDSLTVPSMTRTGVMNPNVGHRHAFDRSDKAIFTEQHQADALTFNTMIRRSASANTAPPIAVFLESAGWNITTTTATTVALYSSTTAWDLGDSGTQYGVPGNAILVKLEDGSSSLDEFYYPVLIAAKATDTVTPGMALPAATANSEPIEVMTTMFPQSRTVVSTKTLSFLYNVRATHTTGEDLAMEMLGCGLSTMGEMTIEPNMPPELAFTFHVSQVDQKNVAIADETFVCGQKFPVITHDCRVELANSADAGGIARTDVILHSATVNWGFAGTPTPGYGSGTKAGIQGYRLDAQTPSITLTADFSKDYWDDMEGSNTSQYLGIVQPTSDLATPAFGVWMPKCHLNHENTVVLNTTDNLITATVQYIGSVADYNSETDNTDEGAAPIYFAISGASS
jgi:hypothetical protein